MFLVGVNYLFFFYELKYEYFIFICDFNFFCLFCKLYEKNYKIDFLKDFLNRIFFRLKGNLKI